MNDVLIAASPCVPRQLYNIDIRMIRLKQASPSFCDLSFNAWGKISAGGK